MIGFNLKSNNFSKTFERIGNRLIGRYDFTFSGFLPGFKISIICATFHWSGKKLVINTALKSWVKNF